MKKTLYEKQQNYCLYFKKNFKFVMLIIQHMKRNILTFLIIVMFF